MKSAATSAGWRFWLTFGLVLGYAAGFATALMIWGANILAH